MIHSPLGSPVEAFTRRMFTQIIERLSAYLVEKKFSVSEIAALHIIQREKSLSVQNLARRLNLSVSATSRLAAGLARRGLLTRKEDPKDARVRYLSCSRRGEKLLDDMSIERVKAIFQLAETLPPQIFREIFGAVSRFQKE